MFEQCEIIQRAYRFAREKMTEHGLFAKGWEFEMTSSKRVFGTASYGRRHGKFRKIIRLSRPLTVLNADKWDEIADTVLHEIAHALDFEERGTMDHGFNWKKICVRVGAKPERCYDGSKMNKPPHAWCLYNTRTEKIVRKYYRKPSARQAARYFGTNYVFRRLEQNA